jgi:hypothetical protein
MCVTGEKVFARSVAVYGGIDRIETKIAVS